MNTCIDHTDKERVEAAEMICVICLIAGIKENAIRERETEIRARDFELMLARLCRSLEKETFESWSPAMKRIEQAIDLLKRKGTASPLRAAAGRIHEARSR